MTIVSESDKKRGLPSEFPKPILDRADAVIE